MPLVEGYQWQPEEESDLSSGVVSHAMWGLGTELSSERAASAFTNKHLSSQGCFFLFNDV